MDQGFTQVSISFSNKGVVLSVNAISFVVGAALFKDGNSVMYAKQTLLQQKYKSTLKLRRRHLQLDLDVNASTNTYMASDLLLREITNC